MNPKDATTPTGNPILDAALAEVQKAVTIETSALALINGFQATMQAAVNAALANGATAAQLAPVSDAMAQLKAIDAQLAAAVQANTPTAPAPAGS